MNVKHWKDVWFDFEFIKPKVGQEVFVTGLYDNGERFIYDTYVDGVCVESYEPYFADGWEHATHWIPKLTNEGDNKPWLPEYELKYRDYNIIMVGEWDDEEMEFIYDYTCWATGYIMVSSLDYWWVPSPYN